MRAIFPVVLLCSMLMGCSPGVSLATEHTEAKAVVVILDSEYQVMRTSVPDLPRQNEVKQDIQPTMRPRAYLITASDFYCPPCEQWKSRLSELPFSVVVQPRTTSPTGKFPCILFPDASSSTGWKQYSGTIEGFLAFLQQPSQEAANSPKQEQAAAAPQGEFRMVRRLIPVKVGRRIINQWHWVQE
ncbi:hypothetical protein SH668x_001251 [Planctomicrobium sp. SH668]|uniref:hypothetical protein n=1 Tax=Planctomicrobium sp. SH668 TaxID=3448126 RepID=UPI003F5C0E20